MCALNFDVLKEKKSVKHKLWSGQGGHRPMALIVIIIVIISIINFTIIFFCFFLSLLRYLFIVL